MSETIAFLGLGNVGTQMAQRLLSGMAKGRQDLDWSALELGAAEDAGLSPQA
jgi:3-hydroxyisobutyrate dehydrogenase-like beta-hydroxyacid dehydrogenase